MVQGCGQDTATRDPDRVRLSLAAGWPFRYAPVVVGRGLRRIFNLRLKDCGQSMARYAVCGLIRLYQLLISPVLPPSCRFYPSCSRYAMQAITRYGVCRGMYLSAWRLLRCHPWHPGGWDPVA